MKVKFAKRAATFARLHRPRYWKWALVPFLALAVLVTWGHGGERPARAQQAPPGIAIVKGDRLTYNLLPSSCYSVWNSTNTAKLFTVCDDDFHGAPVSSPVCIDATHPSGGGLCSDSSSPYAGLLFVYVVPGTYHVVESQAPPGFNLKAGKQICVVSTNGDCDGSSLIFYDDFVGKPNLDGQWTEEVTSPFGNDTCTVQVTQTKGSAQSDPITATGTCVSGTTVQGTGTVGGGQISVTGTAGPCSDFQSTALVSWNGNYAAGSFQGCTGIVYGTFTETRQPTDQAINIYVCPGGGPAGSSTGQMGGACPTGLPGTCWQVFYSIYGKNIPVDIVSDNNAKQLACPSPMGQASPGDSDTGVGSIKITIPAAWRSLYGDQWHIKQYQAPPGYAPDTGKHACDLSLGKCWIFVTDTPACTSPGSHQPDTDCDGCPDVAEQNMAVGSQFTGGLRDYLNPYDYFNPTHDDQNRVDDILKVVGQYYKDSGNPNYNPDTDRTYVGPNQWNLGAPNGQQRVDDILNQVKQYYHDCS